MRLTIVEDRRKRHFGTELYGYKIMDDSWMVAWAERKEHAEFIRQSLETCNFEVHTVVYHRTIELKASSPLGCRLFFPTEYSDAL